MLHRLPRRLFGLSVFTHLASFAAPFDGQWGGGFAVFCVGLMFCWYLPAAFAWWANVLYWVALRNARGGRWGRAAAWAVPATALASSFLLLNSGASQKASKAPAFWLWVASMAVLAAAGLAGWLATTVEAVDAAED